MSCWKKYTCNALTNVDQEIVKQALIELGYGLDENTKHVATSYFGGAESNYATCDAALKQDGQVIQVGITYANKNGELEVQGDFWDTGIDHKSLIEQLTDRYLKLFTQNQCILNGYTIENETVLADGTVEYEAYAWA